MFFLKKKKKKRREGRKKKSNEQSVLFGGKQALLWASQVALVVKNPTVNARDIRDVGLISGMGRSSGGGHRNPL